jgi:hypothetical protein
MRGLRVRRMTTPRLRYVTPEKPQETIRITLQELTRLRAIEEAYRLLIDTEDREVRDMSLREWTIRQNRGRLAIGARSWT